MSAQTTGVRKTVAGDADQLSQTLARAFFDDPLMMHLLSDENARNQKLPRVFKLLFKLAMPYNSCFVTDNFESVALWRPPGGWHVRFWEYLVNGPEMLGVFGSGVLRVMATMDQVEKVHPKAPHWYLQVIGTDPNKQGKGFGGVVMRVQLGAADAAHLPCYLESSKETNIAIYQNFGFKVTGEIKIPDGPTLWPMWRDPR